MTENTKIWDALSKTDPKHTKQFKRAGGFSGTAIKPIWLTKRLTEHFGAAGIGWGMEKPEFQVVPAGDETLVFCTVALWHGSRDHAVYGVGGDKVMGKNKYGPYTNDEAFKASYTDALSNAMKQIGMGADVHMGLFDDEKYVRETAREFTVSTANEIKPTYAVDPDALTGATEWANNQVGLLATMALETDVKAWNAKNVKALVKLKATSETLFDRVMDAYGRALAGSVGAAA